MDGEHLSANGPAASGRLARWRYCPCLGRGKITQPRHSPIFSRARQDRRQLASVSICCREDVVAVLSGGTGWQRVGQMLMRKVKTNSEAERMIRTLLGSG